MLYRRFKTDLLFWTNVTSVGSVFSDTRKVKVLSLPETIKEKSTFPAKALRRELVVTTNSRRRAFARNVDFSFIVSFQVVREPLPFALLFWVAKLMIFNDIAFLKTETKSVIMMPCDHWLPLMFYIFCIV